MTIDDEELWSYAKSVARLPFPDATVLDEDEKLLLLNLTDLVDAADVIPAIPSGFYANALSSASIVITWTDNSSNEDGFYIRRSTDEITFTVVATLPADTESWTDTGLTADTQYFYRVTAFNGAGESVYVGGSATTAAAPVADSPPLVPTDLTGVATTTTVALAWRDNATNEEGYTVWQWDDTAGDWSNIGAFAADTDSYTVTGLTAGTSYQFRVCAFNDLGSRCAITTVTTLSETDGGGDDGGGVVPTPTPSTRWYFRPPSDCQKRWSPEWERWPDAGLWKRLACTPRGRNVYWLTDGTITETQPDPGDASLIVKVWHGGHIHIVDYTEHALLSAAGYDPYMTQIVDRTWSTIESLHDTWVDAETSYTSWGHLEAG